MHFSTKPMQKFGFKRFFWRFIFAYFLDCVLWSKLIPTLITIVWNQFLGRILIFCLYSLFDIKLSTQLFNFQIVEKHSYYEIRLELMKHDVKMKEIELRMILQKWFPLNGSSIGIYSTEWGLLRKQIFIWARTNLSNYCKWK